MALQILHLTMDKRNLSVYMPALTVVETGSIPVEYLCGSIKAFQDGKDFIAEFLWPFFCLILHWASCIFLYHQHTWLVTNTRTNMFTEF